MTPKNTSILIGGLVVAFFSLPYLNLINVLCCLGTVIGGAAAVWHYTSTNELTIPAGEGAGMGALAGVVGGIIGGLLSLLFLSVGVDASDEMVRDFILDRFGAEMTDEQLEQFEGGASGGAGIFGLLCGVVIAALFGALGGAIGAALFKKGGTEPTVADADDDW